MKKRFLCFLLVIVLTLTAVCACACKGNDNNDDEKKPDPINPTADYDPTFPEDDIYNDGSWQDISVRTATGTNGVVASASTQASYAGYKVLRQGGNAFDAAVAIAFALGVTEPYCSGIGGGGIMTGYHADTGEYVFCNFREFAPELGTASYYKKEWNNGNGTIANLPHFAHAAIPTEVAGLLSIVENFGVTSRQTVIEPALNYAKQGFYIDGTLAENLGTALSNVDGAEAIFTIDGIPAGEGDYVKNPDYANVLQEISDKGVEGFYTGWVAEAIVESMQGIFSMDDMTFAMEHSPIYEEPLYASYNDYEIYTVCPPSSGGVIMVEALNMLEHYCKENNTSLAEIGNNTFEYIHLVSLAAQLGYADKRKYVSDPRVENVPIKGLTDKQYASDRWDKVWDYIKGFDGVFTATSGKDWGGGNSTYTPINPKNYPKTTASEQIVIEENKLAEDTYDGGTTTFSVADKDGNIVSFTKTINHFWGNLTIPAGCGFCLNGNLTSFSLTSGSTQEVKPHKQPVTHLMPTIIMKDGKPFATIGTPGATRIPCTVLQIALNLMDFDMTIQDAIENPRFYNYCVILSGDGAEDDLMKSANPDWSHDKGYKCIEVESIYEGDVKNPITQETIDRLIQSKWGVVPHVVELYFGGVQGIKFNYDEQGNLISMTGGADIRRSGKALAY